jgi:hypothetical protein
MCFSFWGVSREDSRLTNQSATWLVYLRGVSISPGKTPKAKTHSVHNGIIVDRVGSNTAKKAFRQLCRFTVFAVIRQKKFLCVFFCWITVLNYSTFSTKKSQNCLKHIWGYSTKKSKTFFYYGIVEKRSRDPVNKK